MTASAFKKEASVMKGLQHRNVLPIYGVCSSEPFSIIMEFMPKKSLLHVLKRRKNFELADFIKMSSQVCLVL